uniref:Putative secreted protein n=1 Tax=Superstitionia donensis TaxID=311983 RepID=A0A1V1WBG9_9SCOR
MTLLNLVLICMYFIVTNAYMYYDPQELGSVDCTDRRNGVHHPVGEQWYIDELCESNTCKQFKDLSLAIITSGCGVVEPGPGCKLVRGTGSYPDCCLDEVC